MGGRRDLSLDGPGKMVQSTFQRLEKRFTVHRRSWNFPLKDFRLVCQNCKRCLGKFQDDVRVATGAVELTGVYFQLRRAERCLYSSAEHPRRRASLCVRCFQLDDETEPAVK